MTDSIDTPVPRPGSSLSLALLASGPHKQSLGHWLMWWHDISSVPYSVSDPTVAERKLAWWAQAVANGFEQTPQHPLLIPLLGSDAARAHAPPLKLWLSQIDGQRQLTQQTRWLDEAALQGHIQATTAAACEGAAWLAGARDDATLANARAFGVALRRAHILIRLGQDARQGWLHVPIDTLQAHEVRAHELLKPAAGPVTEPVRRLLDAWRIQAQESLHQALDQARALPGTSQVALRPLRVLARLNVALLDDLHEANYPVFSHRTSIGPWRKIWIAQWARWR